MKSSVCCTTQSDSFALRLLILALLLSSLTAPASEAQDPVPPPTTAKPADDIPPAGLSLAAVIDANALQKEGKRPFHLKISFQIYDLSGKPGETGNIQYWWAGPEGTHLDVSSPSLGTITNFRPDAVSNLQARRSLYLASELLSNVQNPGAILGLPHNQVQSEERVIGTTVLECMHAVPPQASLPSAYTQVRADSTSGNIRLIEGMGHRIVRNHPGIFAGTQVATEITISWGTFPAISGHVDELQSFDPAQASVTLEKSRAIGFPTAKRPVSVRLASGVIAGNKIGGNAPSYPIVARQNRIQGTVMLLAEITETGHIANLVPLASPDPLLTQAAIDAVNSWTYRPYLLNGNPVRVSTTITVNFNLNPGFH